MLPKNKTKLGRRIAGVVKRHPDGYGFLIADEKSIPDLYVAKHDMDGIMSNDRVKVSVRQDKGKGRMRAYGLEVISRETRKVSGQIEVTNKSQGVLRDRSFSWGEDLKVSIPPNLKVQSSDWVSVKITNYPDHIRGFRGEVELVLGDIDDASNDNMRMLASHEIPFGFSKQAIAEAKSLPSKVPESDIRARKDLRNKKFITIDGTTAKDFDDAIYIEKEASGFRLWVAIADVSHYIKPDSAIDKDAYEKGTSTYFPNFVSPMLPEALSNELCSLKPNVDRLAMTAEMLISHQGELESTNFYECTIKSHARVTYGEAQEILDGEEVKKHEHVYENIKVAAELSNILMKKRFREGSLNLEIPETTIEIDETGTPTDILRGERIFAHKLIEELMLIANVAVAKFIDSKDVDALYRVHDTPKTDAIAVLETYLRNFGSDKKIGSRALQKRISEALKEFSGQPQEPVLNILALRSMNQAQYSPENIGHFGLGFSHYCHFTSPIRRYPDLIIHRILKSIVGGHHTYKPVPPSILDSAGVFLSACEQRSVKAERQLQSIKKARFMHKLVGQEFNGVISSVTKFGVFVLLRRYDVDGLVRIEDLASEYLDFDEQNLCLTAKKSGLTYKIGDDFDVIVAAVDVQAGRIDFVPAERDEVKHGSGQKKNESPKKRGKATKDRERVRSSRVSRSGGKNKTKSVRKSSKSSTRRRK